jgi:fructose-1,6-bisphosphatase/inositol monophosphatase family enzyme
MTQRTLLPDDICDGAVFAIRNTIGHLKVLLAKEPGRALSRVMIQGLQKEALRIDVDAEDQFLVNLGSENSLLRDIRVIGEESINSDTDFTGSDGVIALADMIDGTDLLERNLSNWCSAVVFFRPRNPVGERIVCACVGVTSGKIYYAHSNTTRAFYKDPRGTCEVGGRSKVTSLTDASICFYGQKVSSLKKVMTLPLLDHLEKLGSPRTRVYNLAGIPMMMKLIDHQTAEAANIDLVFESSGQKPHDVVAGAYIAKRAGAYIINLDTGNELTFEDMERSLLRPGDKESELRYVMASTRELCEEALPFLSISRRSGAGG